MRRLHRSLLRRVRSAPRLLAALLVGLACSDAGPERRDILGTEKKLYSQNDEELIIRDFFQDRRGGVFLDVGAADPIDLSTTYYLEKHLGWSGIAVDALPEYAERWRTERPLSKFVNYIATDHAGTKEPFYRTWFPGASSTKKDRRFGGINMAEEEISIPTITLTRLLEDEGTEAIDLLSMDIEEAEPMALAGFDIARFAPELICIEHSPSVADRILAYFTDHGYERIDRYVERDPINWYFRPVPERD